jgi:hypothetical protein
MKDVSPQAQRYLDALRTVDAPAAGASTRVWDAVQTRAAAGDMGPELPSEPSGLASTGGAVSIKSIVLGVLVGTGVAAGGAAAILGGEPEPSAAPIAASVEVPEPEPQVQPVVVPPPVIAPAPAEEDAIEIEADTAPVVDADARPRPKGPRARVESPSAEPAPSVDPVAEEVALLADARSALGAGEASRAISVLARHRKRFPEGLLARERDVSWITALCVLGRVDEARTRAKSFLRSHGSSPHAAKVRASCGGKDD